MGGIFKVMVGMDKPDTTAGEQQSHPAGETQGQTGGLAPGFVLLVDEHEEEESVNGRTVRQRGIYLLPNLFTTGALFAGFYAIIAAMRGNYEAAPMAILVAMVFDGLDGRVARMTHTSSKFGAEYDSLSDMVSFGVAPALVVFSWALGDLGKFGWSVAFIYVACAALRLARFNTQIETADKKFFTGLASPAAACIIASLVWVCHDAGLGGYRVAARVGGLGWSADRCCGLPDDCQFSLLQFQVHRFAQQGALRSHDRDGAGIRSRYS